MLFCYHGIYTWLLHLLLSKANGLSIISFECRKGFDVFICICRRFSFAGAEKTSKWGHHKSSRVQYSQGYFYFRSSSSDGSFQHKYKIYLTTNVRPPFCPLCPHCSTSEYPCSNKFGNNFEPWGGVAGRTAANGCVVEYQRNNNPHAHGDAHKVTAYQHKTLEEIKVLIEKRIAGSTNNLCLPNGFTQRRPVRPRATH